LSFSLVGSVYWGGCVGEMGGWSFGPLFCSLGKIIYLLNSKGEKMSTWVFVECKLYPAVVED